MDKLGQQIFADELYPASIEIFSYDEYFYPNQKLLIPEQPSSI